MPIDENVTKHIWKLKFGVTEQQIADTNWLAQDTDADGQKNDAEMAAGTDPFNGSKTVKIGSISRSGANVTLQFPTELGKRYQVESTTNLGNTTWTSLVPTVDGDGTDKALTVAYTANTFYRVRVRDIDTDADGVSDWAERAVSLNPAATETVTGTNDLAYVSAQITLPNEVTISAPTPFASEDGPSAAMLKVTRKQNLFPLTVKLTASGTSTAIGGTDYKTQLGATEYNGLPGTVAFSARGALEENIFVNPVTPQATPKGGRSVTAMAEPMPNTEFPFAPSSATVIINPSTVAAGTGLLGRYYDTASTIAADAANLGQASDGFFVYTRVGASAPFAGSNIVVPTDYSGPPAIAAGTQVRLSFNGGGLDNTVFDNQIYTVSSVVPGVSFTVGISGTGLPTSYSNNTCSFSVLSSVHRPALERVDATVNFDWQLGTPNGVTILPNNSADNYSDIFETYLSPTAAGTYRFQLDADDRARVFLDTGTGLTQILEHNWDTPHPVGSFKESLGIPLVVPATPAQRYKLRVEHVETTGNARCRLQWSLNGGGFNNIPQAQQFTHTQALNYLFNGTSAVIVPTGGHSLAVNDTVKLAFSSGILSTPGTAAGTYSTSYTITAVSGAGAVTLPGSVTVAASNTITVPTTAGLSVGMAVTGTGLPANQFITGIDTVNNRITVTTGSGVSAQASTTLTATSTFTVAITPFPITVAGATTTLNGNVVFVPSTAGLVAGMAITGTGLPAGVTISSVINQTPHTPGIVVLSTGTGVTAQASTTLTATLPTTAVLNGVGFVQDFPSSTTTGVLNLTYPNTTLSGSPGRIGVDAAVTAGNNGLWLSGTPDANLIQPDSFSVRWSGQVQPQFSEEYTFIVQADDGCTLSINGQTQPLRVYTSLGVGGSTYSYDPSGTLLVTYSGLTVPPGTFTVGETVRIDPTTSTLNHAPTTSPTYTYTSSTGLAVIDYTNILVGQPGGTIVAGSFQVGDVIELDPTLGVASGLPNLPYTITAVSGNTFTVNFGPGTYLDGTGNVAINDSRNVVVTGVFTTGSTYTYGSGTGFAVIDYTNLNALGVPQNSITVGSSVTLDPVSGNLSALTPTAYTVTAATATTFTVFVGTTFTTGSGSVNIASVSGGPIPLSATTAFTVAFPAGRYAAATGNLNIDIANQQIRDWASNAVERYVRIPMVGGARYDIQLDYYESSSAARATLSWFSPSQPRQVIPAERLYPASSTPAPPSHVSPTVANALANGPFSYEVKGSNNGVVSISGAPAWLTYSNGILSGTPPADAAGDYQIVITITNAAGSTKSLLLLHVDVNGGTVTREHWSGVPGTAVASIPTTTPPTGTTTLSSLEAPTDFGDNYGVRVRGYITAPVSGNYYFWIAANNTAELWISNDDEPVNAFKRAWLTAGSTSPRNWAIAGQTAQKSPWLALEEGKKYYFEILHKAGAAGDGSDHLAIGWAKPGQPTTTPSEVVPGYVLSPYTPPAPGSTPGTLYVSTMLAQPGAVTSAVGSSTLRLSEDETYAIMRYSYRGLTGPITAQHIHVDAYLNHTPGTIVYDIDTPGVSQTSQGGGLQPDGSHKWIIEPIGTLSVADIREIIRQGKAYINLHTAVYPNGEIRGNYTLAAGTRTFTPPPAPPAWSEVDTVENASRFLSQATFGANPADIRALRLLNPSGATNSRYETWIDNQFNVAQTNHLPEVLARELADVFGPFDTRLMFNTWWKVAMTAPDQLRQRVAFSLSQIHVVSGQGPLEDNSRSLSDFYDTLATNAFGNFRTLLRDTTLTPAMGRYLDMLRNDKPDLAVGRIPNENYAREIKQLFSIGLFRMWPDGTLMLTSDDSPIDTYAQREIVGLSHVFTGWDYGYNGTFLTGFSAIADWTRPMREIPARHFTGPKRVLNNEVLPGLDSAGGQPLDPYANHVGSQIFDPAYQALPNTELETVHDMLFNHPNTGPFVCRQLIQRMVTSNPSRDYLYRVVQKFNDNGAGVRGDMKAVVKAVLLDYEARSGDFMNIPAYGKQREPILRVAQVARAFRPTPLSGSYTQGANNVITITAAGHPYITGNSVFLEFTDSSGKPAPSTGQYTVTGASGNTFTVNAPGWITGTYNQAANSPTMTITLSGHWVPGDNAAQNQVLPLPNEGRFYADFTSGTADGLASFDQTVQQAVTSTSFDTPSGVGNTGGSTFTITAPTSTSARSGNLMIARMNGSFSSTGRNGVITVDTSFGGAGTWGNMADHGLSVGNQVFMNFAVSRDTTSFNETSTENDIVYTVTSVPDPNTFTIAARDAANAAMGSDNNGFVFPLVAPPLNRSGTVVVRAGTYNMDNTDADLQQTPMNSPTVFNYFLPDYKFAGTLASQGITTPEFQLTSETTVIRQANFIFNGLFNPANNTLSSFRSGSNSLILDLNPWMANANANAGTPGQALGAGPQTAQWWTNTANVGTLIDRLNSLLLGGTLPAAAKEEILNFVGRPIASVTTGSPAILNTSVAHSFAVGDSVTITGITGGTWSGASTNGNGTFVVTAVPSTTQIRLATAVTGGTNLNCTSTTTNGGLNLTNSNMGPISYTNTSPPSVTDARNRLRAIIHLLLTSPDYTIQR